MQWKVPKAAQPGRLVREKQGMKHPKGIPYMLGAEVVIEGFVGLHNSVPNLRQLSDDVRLTSEEATGHGAL